MISPSMMPSTLLALLIASLGTRSIDGASAFVGTPRTGGGISSTPRRPPRRTSSTKPLRQRQQPPCHTASRATRLRSSPGAGFGNKAPKRNKPPSPELFELQELRAQLQTVLRQDVLYQTLSAEKREELTKYVKAVVEKTESPIDFSGRGGNTFGTAQFAAGVEGRSWRMVFSTDDGDGGDGAGGLPYGSTVVLRIGEFVGSEGKMDYVLKFSKKVMGLNELVAKSTCAIDIGAVNPGLFTFEYEDIKTNIFGVSNLPVGFFGLLKGRVNYIDTVWFDGDRWIEKNYSENGDVVYSVYVRDIEDEKSN